jgi:glycosyltransferase involved in cell wall biosynthesis
MNIAMVSVYASPLAVGVRPHESLSVHIAELARELGRIGHTVTVYTHRDGHGSGERVRFAPGVTVEHVSAADALPMSEQELLPHIPEFAKRLARRWTDDRPDVIHAYDWLSGLAAISGADGLGIPVVQSFHELATLEQRAGRRYSAPRARLEKAIGRSAHALVTTTGGQRAGLLQLGVPRPRIAVVPSGVDVEKFSPLGPALPRGEAPRILTVMQPAEWQGVKTLIEALARIPGAELVVAGGPPRDELDGDPDIHRLRITAKDAGVAERVTFLGEVGRAEMPGLMRSADLTVSLSSRETSGRVPVESMACGTPVVVSAVGGHLDAVIDDVTGIHATPGRPLELARRIRGLLAEPTHLAALGIAGSDRVQSRYSWERIANETLKVYKTVCAVPEPAAAEPDLEPDLAVAS